MKRAELLGCRKIAGGTANLIETSGAANRRTILQGKWGGNPVGCSCLEPSRTRSSQTAQNATRATGQKHTGDGTTSRPNGRQRDFKRIELGGGQKLGPWTGDYRSLGTWKRWDLSGRRQAGVASGATITDGASTTTRTTQETGSASSTGTQAKPTGTTGEGGVFSQDSKEQFGEKSIFNKEKWLPLARDVPVPISHLCCHKMKKSPMQIYQRAHKVVPFIGTLAEESRIRQQAWIRHGCNAFDSKKPQSTPIAFWTEQDILQYIVEYGLDIAAVYGDVVAADEDGNEYAPNPMMCAGCKLKCTGADRTGQINAARRYGNVSGKTV